MTKKKQITVEITDQMKKGSWKAIKYMKPM